MKAFEKKIGSDGRPYLETELAGALLTRLPLLNKGTGFTPEEREQLGLGGLIPTHVSTLDEQVARAYANFGRLGSLLDKYVFLRELQDSSEVVFYALIDRHVEELLPIIYTPVVAEGVQQFSRIYRAPRGLVVNPENIDRIDALLENTALPEVQLIVATDNEGILGIGDQGLGGMAICIGKLSLYTVAAGIDPGVALPVDLDVGTNRQDLLDDPLYLGVRRRRMEGAEYEQFIEKFVRAFARRFPHALVQWEDFSKQKAFDVLERYRDVVPSFNDDIQGTGAVVLAGLLTAMRRSEQRLADQTFLVHGAGAGGIGVARQIVRGLQREGLSEAQARARIFVIDSKGLVLADRRGMEQYKYELAQPPERVAGWKVAGKIPSLLETIEQAKVTVLLGLSGQTRAFDEPVVRAVARNAKHPVVCALSNPTSSCEAEPKDVLEWSEGRAIVATGSPFPPVVRDGRVHVIGQGNNAFIFPGVGLAVLLAGARRVTDGMMTAAALALSEYCGGGSLEQGLYPRVDRLKDASREVAVAVLRRIREEGLATRPLPTDLNAFVEAQRWRPEFLPIRRKNGAH